MSLAPLQRRFSRGFALAIAAAVVVVGVAACQNMGDDVIIPSPPSDTVTPTTVAPIQTSPTNTSAPVPPTPTSTSVSDATLIDPTVSSSDTLEATPTAAARTPAHPATTPPADTSTPVPPTAIPPTDTPTPVPPTNTPAPLPPQTGHRVGQSAPDFEVTTIDGVTRSLTDFKQASQPVVLYFFASW